MLAEDSRSRRMAVYSLGVGLLGWGLLVRATHWDALRMNLWPLLLFSTLSLIIKRFGVHISRDVTHSLVGVVDLAAVLALGPVLGAWAAVMSGFLYLELRALRRRMLSWQVMGEHPIFSSGLKALLALGCGTLYLRLGGAIPPSVVTWPMLFPLATTLLAWYFADLLAWATRVFLRVGAPGAVAFLQPALPYSILVELAPMPLSIVIALAYAGMGTPVFVLLSLALLASGALLQRLTQVGTRLKERAAELAVLNELARRLVEAQLDVGQLCQLLCEYVTKVVEAPILTLELLQPDQNSVDVVVDLQHGQLQPRHTLPMTGSMRWMSVQREPFMTGNVPRDGLPFDAAEGDSTDTSESTRAQSPPQPAFARSLLMLPLLAGRQLIGLLSVQSNETYAFEEDDLRVLAAMASQTAMAISSARVYEAEQRRARQLAAIHEVSRRVASVLELDRLFADVVKLVQETFHYYHVGIFTVDADSGEATFRASTNPLIQQQGAQIRKGEGIIAAVAEGSGPILANDVAKDKRYVCADALTDTRAELAVPLQVEARIVGVLDVQSNVTNAFTQEDLFVMQTLADQVAIAVHDARLYAERQQEAWVTTALLQVAQALVSADDLHDNIARITRLTPLLVGVDRCMVFLWDKQREEFTAFEAQGLSKELAKAFARLRFGPGQLPLLDEVRKTMKYVAVEDALASNLIPESLQREFHVRSALAVPLSSKEDLLGALWVDHTEDAHRFPAQKISIIEGIAHQTGIAIESARLYQASLEQERISQELRLAREIQESFLPECCPYYPGWEFAADWHAARGVGGDFYDFIPMGEGYIGLVIADVSDKGMPAAMFMSMSRTLVRASAIEVHSPAQTLQRVNELIMSDTRSGMFVTIFYGVLKLSTGVLTYACAGHNPPILWCAQTSQATPLGAKGIALGVMESIELEQRQTALKPGDILILYTDGVTEPINVHEEEFGEERLVQAVAEVSHRPSTEMVEFIRAAVARFVGDQPQFDDYTLVAVKRKK